MFSPHDLTKGERDVVRALASRKIVVASRGRWWIKGQMRPIDDRAVAGVLTNGLATISGNIVSATPMTQEMRRRLDRWGRP